MRNLHDIPVEKPRSIDLFGITDFTIEWNTNIFNFNTAINNATVATNNLRIQYLNTFNTATATFRLIHYV